MEILCDSPVIFLNEWLMGEHEMAT